MKTRMRLILVVALLSTVALFSADAQRGPGRGHGPGHGPGFGPGPDSCRMQLMVYDMAEAIGLSEAQEKQIIALHYAHMEEIKAIPAQYKNDCVGEREARLASRKKFDESIKNVLKDDQVAKYDEFMSQRRGPHGPKPGPGYGPR